MYSLKYSSTTGIPQKSIHSYPSSIHLLWYSSSLPSRYGYCQCVLGLGRCGVANSLLGMPPGCTELESDSQVRPAESESSNSRRLCRKLGMFMLEWNSRLYLLTSECETVVPIPSLQFSPPPQSFSTAFHLRSIQLAPHAIILLRFCSVDANVDSPKIRKPTGKFDGTNARSLVLLILGESVGGIEVPGLGVRG